MSGSGSVSNGAHGRALSAACDALELIDFVAYAYFVGQIGCSFFPAQTRD
jgi:hypothetical protein